MADSHADAEQRVYGGRINIPEKKPDPDQPDKPGTDDNTDKVYLFETKWKDSSKIVPGSSTDKNPNVGIARGSDDAYVFIYVKNAMVKEGTTAENTPYFALNDNWKPVDGQVTSSADGQYLSGLFMYAKGATDDKPVALSAKSATEDVYTGELFSKVVFPGTLEGSMVATNPTMKVSAYIFGADQTDGNTSAADNAVTQAKTWANTIKNQ
ncbi:hypothetical protein ACEG18_09160 [Collinsella aerofaciens]|uniref:hypothetical protein n=1 Tax=Collinsella aerofaciens TaxID=74426 RepID=UPI00355B12D6